MKILGVVFGDEIKAILAAAVPAELLTQVNDANTLFDESENYHDGDFAAIVIEVSTPEFANEAGQVLRNQCPRTPIFACALDRTLFAPKLLKKNGFTDAFLLPVDRDELTERLTVAVSAEAQAKRALKRVLIPDLEPGSTPSFTTFVHLPLNGKHLVFSKKDEPFSEKKAAKLREHSVGSLFIEQKDSGSFYEYVASQMKKNDNSLSATERQEKLKDSVRQIFTEVFDVRSDDTFDSGRELLDSCRKMVSAYITDGSGGGDLHGQLLRGLGGAALEYTHSADVSTLAALFGMALGSSKVEDLAIAGFLHDLALANFPAEHGAGVDPTWTDDLKREYLEHPKTSVNLIKTKKMIVSPAVETMILQHHERFDGKGFPRGLAGDRVNREAQILSLADQYQYLLAGGEGRARLKPPEILRAIADTGSIAPDLMRSALALLTGPPAPTESV